MDVADRFGKNLADRRRRAGISQEELGFRASLHRTEIGMLERGGRLARIDTLLKLAGALSVSPEELLEGINWIPGVSRPGQFGIAPEPPGTDARQAGLVSPTSSA